MDDEELYKMKEECLLNMTEVYERYEQAVAEAGGDTSLFATWILEQWRPW